MPSYVNKRLKSYYLQHQFFTSPRIQINIKNNVLIN